MLKKGTPEWEKLVAVWKEVDSLPTEGQILLLELLGAVLEGKLTDSMTHEWSCQIAGTAKAIGMTYSPKKDRSKSEWDGIELKIKY